MKVELWTPDDRPPQPCDMITQVTWNAGRYTVSVEPTRPFYARHFIAVPWSLFRWSVRLGWQDLKRMLLGAPNRPIETVADAQERPRSIRREIGR